MAYYGSNYPSNYGGYGYTSGYPTNSGPPPPGGSYGYGYGGGYNSAYNVNQYGYGGGGYSYSSGAVPGFTAPAQQYVQQQGGQAPPPMNAPASMQYNMANQMMTQMAMNQAQLDLMQKMGLLKLPDDEEEGYSDDEEYRRRRRQRRRRRRDDDEEEFDEEAERAKLEEKMRREQEEIEKAQEALRNDENLKGQMKAAFIDELMRRQECNGTFEPTEGTILPFKKYSEDDPVAKWFRENKGDEIAGEKWDALWDAEYLRDGCKGWGTDEDAIIHIVSTRCNAQRNQLLRDYKTSYGRDLIEDLASETSGNFRQCILALFETPARYDAWACKNAIYGLGTDEATLIEILMTRTNAQITEMRDQYDKITYANQKNPDSSLENDIRDDTSGDFKRLLVAAATGNRRLIDRESLEEAVEETMVNDNWTGMFHINYDKLVNKGRCQKMAEELKEAGIDKWGTDEETFIRIFSSRDYYTLRAVWDEYVKQTQCDIMNSVDSETSGNFKKGLKAIAQNIKCRPMYFAERLKKAIKGLGTDDSTLIRVIVSRSEIDLEQIKACFLEITGQTLWKWIKDDTSGDYRKLLLGIVDEEATKRLG